MRSSVPVLAVSHKFYAIRVAVDIAPFSGSRFAKRGQSKSSISLAFSGNKNCITARRDAAWAQKRKMIDFLSALAHHRTRAFSTMDDFEK